ncbi:hypothetical protein [Nocardia sp. NPDC019255]|uniref:hypothetical protein n=1 Tax=Nocardia sp. NPDC019255 TaxID=3154591 RepID=UPI0033C321AC
MAHSKKASELTYRDLGAAITLNGSGDTSITGILETINFDRVSDTIQVGVRIGFLQDQIVHAKLNNINVVHLVGDQY